MSETCGPHEGGSDPGADKTHASLDRPRPVHDRVRIANLNQEVVETMKVTKGLGGRGESQKPKWRRASAASATQRATLRLSPSV